MELDCLYVAVLFVCVTTCNGGVMTSTDDSLDDDLEPVVELGQNYGNALQGLSFDRAERHENAKRDIATTKKSSMWLTGQHGGWLKNGLEKNVKLDRDNKLSSGGSKTQVELVKPQFDSINNFKSDGFDMGYGYMTEDRYDDFKWGDLNFDQILSDLDNTNFDVFLDSNKLRGKREIAKEARKDESETTMSDQDRNDGTTMRVDGGVQTENPGSKSGKREIKEIPAGSNTLNSTNTTSNSVLPLKNNNQSDITTSTPEKKDNLVASENSSIVKSAHHFIQRWMFWKNYKTKSMSFQDANMV